MDKASLALIPLFAHGRQLVKDGQMAEKSKQKQLVEDAQA